MFAALTLSNSLRSYKIAWYYQNKQHSMGMTTKFFFARKFDAKIFCRSRIYFFEEYDLKEYYSVFNAADPSFRRARRRASCSVFNSARLSSSSLRYSFRFDSCASKIASGFSELNNSWPGRTSFENTGYAEPATIRVLPRPIQTCLFTFCTEDFRRYVSLDGQRGEKDERVK